MIPLQVREWPLGHMFQMILLEEACESATEHAREIEEELRRDRDRMPHERTHQRGSILNRFTKSPMKSGHVGRAASPKGETDLAGHTSSSDHASQDSCAEFVQGKDFMHFFLPTKTCGNGDLRDLQFFHLFWRLPLIVVEEDRCNSWCLFNYRALAPNLYKLRGICPHGFLQKT